MGFKPPGRRRVGDAMLDWNSKSLRRRLMVGAAFAGMALSLSSTGAWAQATQPATPAADSEEKVTVTARKRKESLKDAPVTVTAFTPATMERLNIQSIDDIARFTPGLSFSKTFGRSTDRPVIRGQSNVLANVQFGVESGAAYFVDGNYYGGSIQSLDLGDVQRVEVIKGPQSALFGRNTYSGAVNFITRQAGDEFRATGSVKGGSNGLAEYKASMDIPLGETMGVRVSAREYSYDGEYVNLNDGSTVGSEYSRNLSASIDWRPADNLTIRARIMDTHDRDGTLPLFLQSAAFNNCMPGFRSLSSFAASGSANQNQYYCGVIKPQNFVNLNTGPRTLPLIPLPGVPNTIVAGVGGTVYNAAAGIAFAGIERDVTFASGQVNWDVFSTGYNVTVNMSRRDEDEKFGSDSDHSPVNFFNPPGPPSAEAFFANTSRDRIQENVFEAKLSSPEGNWYRWSIGYFDYNQVNEGFDITFAQQSGCCTRADILTIQNNAFFGMIEADLFDGFTATAELRYAEEQKHLVTYNAAGTAITFDRTGDFHRLTPRLTLRYKPEENITLYAIYSEGVKPGGLNGAIGLGVSKPTYAQETSKNQEIGMKAEWFEGVLTTNIAAYHIDAQNVQLTTAVPPLGGVGATTSIVTNQGTGETWGVELDFRAFVSENFNFGGSYSWTDPTFTEGCDEDQWILTSGGGLLASGPAPGTGTQQAGFVGNCSIKGKRYPLVPAHQATLSAEYRSDPVFEMMNQSWNLVASADVTYESSKFVQVHNLAETGSTTLVGGRLALEGENWTLALLGRNLTDEDTVTLCTRWFTTPYGFSGPPLTSSAPAGFSRSSPRGFFCGLRDGASAAVELKFNY
jgi:outer membrane receptor protein involved in Fe transport